MSKGNNAKTGFTFEEVCLSFIEKNRFYTVLLSKIAKVPMKSIPTAGVGFNKHGKLTMYYNPNFVASLPLAEAQGLIEHECNHIIFRHLTRFPMKNMAVSGALTGEKVKGLIKDAHDNKLINWGTDMAINQYIKDLPTFKADDPVVKQGLAKAGDNMGIYPETHNMPRELAAEYYVAELRKLFPEPPKQPECPSCGGTGKKQQDQQQGQQNQQQSGQGSDGQDDQGKDKQQAKGKGKGQQDQQDGQGDGEGEGQGQDQHQHGQGHGSGDGEACPDCNGTGQGQSGPGDLDSHDLWGKVVEVDEDGNVQMSDVADHPDIDPEYECEATVMKAIKECKDYGKVPAHVQAEIDRLKTVKRHDWKKTLKVFINTVLTVNKKRTQKKVDKRLTCIVDYLSPGKKKARRPRVLYVRDTSGSMFSDEIQTEIANELEQLAKRCDVYVADADTKVHQTYRFRKASDLKPYKGGGGTCFRDAFKEAKKLGVDGVIYATDTYGSFPEGKEIGKLARATIWLTFGQDKVEVPFGRHVNIDPSEYPSTSKRSA